MIIGFLPFYIALYDQVVPAKRESMQNFADHTAQCLRNTGLEVIQSPICRVKEEFAHAVELFEEKHVNCIVTLHLAYSPSLESAEILAKSPLDIVMLDTTPDYEFGFENTDKIMNNHGIHGVQDLANQLCRRKKRFCIEAGHLEHSDVLQRLKKRLLGMEAAQMMRQVRIGSVGGRFAGMGDFCFDLKDLPMEIVPYREQSVSPEEIRQEKELDRDRFIHDSYDEALYDKTICDSLKIRKWIEQEKLHGFTICFPGINRPQWETVPFLEASKAMARQIGYAGEGDCLTAAYCASVMKVFPETTFSEMFCPDWKNNCIFLSHMGEINLALAAQKPLLKEYPYKFSNTGNLIKGTACLRGGDAILSNLAPGPDGSFILSCAQVEMFDPGKGSLPANTGYFTPRGSKDIGTFLTRYSEKGATHHLLISYEADIKVLETFAHFMHWDFRLISE